MLNDSEIHKVITNLSLDYLNFSSEIKDSEIKGFTDLQAYMITMQRLSETSEYLFSDINISKNNNYTLFEKEILGFAIVRFKSAIYWSKFFGIEEDEDFTFDDSSLHNSCLSKLNEVEGYLNYVKTYLSLPLVSTSNDLKKAYEDYYNKNYALCLFKSIKAKADAELILSSLNIGIDGTDDLIIEKEKIARNTIANSINKGIFPLIAYSYYTYGNSLSLKESDKYSALLYYEYASAMSDISVYFEKKESTNKFALTFPREYYTILSLGVILGMSISGVILLFSSFFSRKKTKKKIPVYKRIRK
jgi:predicted S18 family serine protease